jgi:putative addiction module component (TIGR02574 family)
MAMTAEQILKEARHLPHDQIVDLVDQLTLTLQPEADAEIEQAWKAETRRRLADLENGVVQPVPAEAVSARVRKIIGR